MRKPLRVSFVALTLFPSVVRAQAIWTATDAMAFCKHDKRPEIAAYCKDLASLQTAVNAERSSSTPDMSPSNVKFTDALNKLDLTSPRAIDDLITATAVAFATKAAASTALRDAGQQRPDRQLSANSSSSGTTSLVSKTGSAELLSLALDTGALTSSVNGTTTTLSTNADQIFRLITGTDPDCTVTCVDRGWFETNGLNHTNISAAFNLAEQSSTTTPTTGQASGTSPVPVSSAPIPKGVGKLASITARYELMNKFDPRSQKFKDAWRKQVTSLKQQVVAVGDDTDAVLKILQSHKAFSGSDADTTKLVQQAQGDLVAAAAGDSTGHKLIDAFETFWNHLVTMDVTNDPKLASAVAKTVQDRAIYRAAWYAALDNAVGNLLTFEYSYNRPVNQPNTQDFKLIYAYNFGGMGMLTFNGAASFYSGSLPAGAKYGQLHYGQISGQYDRTLSGKDKGLQTQLTLAGYWQYQPDPSVLNIPAGTVVPGTDIPLPNGTQQFVGTAGSLWVTQAKFTIKGAGGISVPIAVSWSNKTNLLQGNNVGGQVGISYNFWSLAGLFSGGNP